MRYSRAVVVPSLVGAVLVTLLLPSLAYGATPSVIGADGASAWTYKDLADVGEKYEGGYARFQTDVTGSDGLADDFADPHGGYDTATNKCKVCHAVHRAEGSYYLLRADSQDDACDYCHIGGSAHSSLVVYDLNSGGKATENGHTIGASTYIPDSSTAQWTEEVTLESVDAEGQPLSEVILVRAYDEQKNDMYRFARHHGHSAATGGSRRNYVPVGPLALRCMSCHQVHDAEAQTWQSISMASMTNTGRYTSEAVSSYKLLKQFPSGTFVGDLDAYGQVPLSNLSLVPETTLTAGVNFDAVRAPGSDPTALTLQRDFNNDGDMADSGENVAYNKPMWVAQNLSNEGYAASAERSDPAAVSNAALSVWCADCHNLNIGGSVDLNHAELGFKAHSERTHPAPFVGAFNGPGQCYSCHRSDLPRQNTGDPCSQCHYGTGSYRENRYERTSTEYVASDFPHSGEDGDYKMLGSYSVDVEGLSPTTIVESVTVGPDNLDAVCVRCHWVEERYHDDGADSHVLPSLYTECYLCHTGSDVTVIHSELDNPCGCCHDAPELTTDCSTCHPTIAGPDGSVLPGHGFDPELHTAAVGGDIISGTYASGDAYGPITCAECHAMLIGGEAGEHAKASSSSAADGCANCHPSPRNTLTPAWGKGCVQGGCHPTGSPSEQHLLMAAAHAQPAENADCTASGCHDDGDLADVHEGAPTQCLACHSATSFPDTNLCTDCHPDPHADMAEAHTAIESGGLSWSGKTTDADVGTWVMSTNPKYAACTQCHYLDITTEHAKASSGSLTCAACHAAGGPVDSLPPVTGWDGTCAACHITIHANYDGAHVSYVYQQDNCSDCHDYYPDARTYHLSCGAQAPGPGTGNDESGSCHVSPAELPSYDLATMTYWWCRSCHPNE